MTTATQEVTDYIRRHANPTTGSFRIIRAIHRFYLTEHETADILRTGLHNGTWTYREDDYSSHLTDDERTYCPTIGNQQIHVIDVA